tara:strand:- start:14627 stop:15361 length:735 start_codon:yes stop_codon:yes gene_type:complete
MTNLNLRKLNAIDSTNKALKKMLFNNKIVSGDGIWTMNQTNGVGQLGSKWQSKPNDHLALSIYKSFDKLDAKWIYSINTASSLAVVSTLNFFDVPNVSIKWPNDILSDDKKICGILAENQINKTHIRSIIGFGINLHEQSFPELPSATSVFIKTNKKILINNFIEKLSENLIHFFMFCSTKSTSKLNRDLQNHIYGIKKESLFEIQKQKIKASIEGVMKNGLLKLKLSNGKIKYFKSKEIKMIY